MRFIYLPLLFSLLFSCSQKDKKEGPVSDGVRKFYYQDGKLYTEVTYKNGRQHGLSKQYFKSGVVQKECYYKNDTLHGECKVYNRKGGLKEVTPYTNGKRDGIQKRYHENGQLMAEIPYEMGAVGVGLKEYTKDGKLKTDYPEIVITAINNLSYNNEYILNLSLTKSFEMRNVKFYIGDLKDDKYLAAFEGIRPIETKDFQARLTYNIPRGGFEMQVLPIIAEVKTFYENPLIITRNYKLAVENK